MTTRPRLAVASGSLEELLRALEEVLFRGRRDIEHAWVRTYHETGRLICEHLLLHQERAGYGARVYQRAAARTRVSTRILYQCVQFFRCFPIVQTSAQLGWSHYQLLCQVGDLKQRAALTAQARKHDWKAAELESRVRAFNATTEIDPGPGGSTRATGPGQDDTADSPLAINLLSPKRGTVGVYRLVARDDGLAIDVGFKLYLPLSPSQSRHRKAGDLVRYDDGRLTAVAGATPADLFTFATTRCRVVDGDTVAVGVRLPHYLLEVKLRLRGLDCPEMNTAEGKAAKRAVEALVRDATSITINTTKPDKYDRYLADVFLETIQGEVFLNNLLLEQGLADRKDAWEFGDWEKQARR